MPDRLFRIRIQAEAPTAAIEAPVMTREEVKTRLEDFVKDLKGRLEAHGDDVNVSATESGNNERMVNVSYTGLTEEEFQEDLRGAAKWSGVLATEQRPG